MPTISLDTGLAKPEEAERPSTERHMLRFKPTMSLDAGIARLEKRRRSMNERRMLRLKQWLGLPKTPDPAPAPAAPSPIANSSATPSTTDETPPLSLESHRQRTSKCRKNQCRCGSRTCSRTNNTKPPYSRLPPVMNITAGVGNAARSFTVMTRQICFYSPTIRKQFNSRGWPSSARIPREDGWAFEVACSWTKLRNSSDDCDLQIAALKFAIAQLVPGEIPFEFRLWFTTNRLGGAFLTLRDQCMQYIYEEDEMKRLQITPAILQFTMREAIRITSKPTPGYSRHMRMRYLKKRLALPHFVATCALRDRCSLKIKKIGTFTWAECIHRLAGSKFNSDHTNPMSMGERYGIVQDVDWYLCKAGDVEL